MRFKNLRAEMARKGLKAEDFAGVIDVHRNAVYRKMNGKSPFMFEEARAIRDSFFPEQRLEDLFEDDAAARKEPSHAGA